MPLASAVQDGAAGGTQDPPVGLGAGRRRDAKHDVLRERPDHLPSGRRVPNGSVPRATARIPSRTMRPEHDHAAVRGAEMLERVHRDGPLARLSVEVRGVTLSFGVGAIVGLSEARLRHLLRLEPQAGSTCASSKFVVWVSSFGTAQR